jgi:hypothetical protein
LLLFECWLCLTSIAHQHNILFVDKSRADFQSRRPRHSLTETHMGLMMTSGVLFVCHALTIFIFQGRVTAIVNLVLKWHVDRHFLRGLWNFS